MRVLEIGNWKVSGYYPYAPILGKSAETGGWFHSVTPEIDAVVPGNIYTDLYRAGLIPDPRVEMNSLSCEWISQRWWIYRTSFRTPADWQGRAELRFGGIDFRAEFYLNGTKFGETQNMFLEYSFDITALLNPPGEENCLKVLLCGVPDEMGQIGYTSRAISLKSRFTYKWDFSVRLIHMGLTGTVRLCEKQGAEICGLYVRTEDPAQGIAKLFAEIESSEAESGILSFSLISPGGKVFSLQIKQQLRPGRQTVMCRAEIPDMIFWEPNGVGVPALYELRAEWRGRSNHAAVRKTGFRTVEFLQNEGAPAGALPYTLYVNGKKNYIKGVNYVPLDVMYGGTEAARYEQFFQEIAAANVNLVRVWGGGILEQEIFYALADRWGILVWQEFPQSSGGLDNVPCIEPAFLQNLKKTAEFELRKLREHPSVCIWGGGNELTDAAGRPCGMENENVAMLAECTARLAPDAVFFPTSASGPSENRMEDPSQNHDVHGPWQYCGPEEHYRFYNETSCLLHSEFGVEGMSGPASLKKFLSEENLVVSDKSNPVWRHHGEWWISTERDASIFGRLESLEDLVLASQFLQAEGLRYALEANRRCPRNSGSIVWQADESFPNVACTSLIDYYGAAKPALVQVGKAYCALNLSLRYQKLLYRPGEEIPISAFVIWDGPPEEIDCLVEIRGGPEERCFRKSVQSGFGKAVEVFSEEDFDQLRAPDCGGLRIRLYAKGSRCCFENRLVLLVKNERGHADLTFVKNTIVS